MNELLECPICNNQYDNAEFMPKFIECGNGHTICLGCCQGIYEKHQNRIIQCPFDNEIVQQSPKKLQTNLIVLQMIDNINHEELKCLNHNEVNNIYCKNCQQQICYKCVINSSHKNHEIAEVKDIYQDFYNQVESVYKQIQTQKSKLQDQIEQFDHQKQKLKGQVLEYQDHVECSFDSLISTLQEIKDHKLKQVKEESDKIINTFEEANTSIQKRILQMMNIQKPEKATNYPNIATLVNFLSDEKIKNLAYQTTLPQVNYNFKYEQNQQSILDQAQKNLYTFQLSMSVQQISLMQKKDASLVSVHDDIFNRTYQKHLKAGKKSAASTKNLKPLDNQAQMTNKQFNKGNQLIEQLKQRQKLQTPQNTVKLRGTFFTPDYKPPRRKTIQNNNFKTDGKQVQQKKLINQLDEPKTALIKNITIKNLFEQSVQKNATFEDINFDCQSQKGHERSISQAKVLQKDQNSNFANVKSKSPIKAKSKIQKRPFSIELSLQETYASNQFLPGEILELVWNIKNTGTTKLPSCTVLTKSLQRDQNQREIEQFIIGEIAPQKSNQVFVIIEVPSNVGCYNYEFQCFIDQNKLGTPQIYTVNVTKDFLLISDKKYATHLNYYTRQQDKKPFKLLFEKRNIECFWEIYDDGWCDKFEVGDVIKHVIVAGGDFYKCQSDLRSKYARMHNIISETYTLDKPTKHGDNCQVF